MGVIVSLNISDSQHNDTQILISIMTLKIGIECHYAECPFDNVIHSVIVVNVVMLSIVAFLLEILFVLIKYRYGSYSQQFVHFLTYKWAQ